MQKINFKAIGISWCFIFIILTGFSQESVKDELRKKAQEAAAKLSVSPPNMQSPVSVNATTIWSNDKKQLAVIMKVEVLDNWHIYALVPPDQPYIQSEMRLSSPFGLAPLEQWETPPPYPYADGVFIYKGTLLFIRYFSVTPTTKKQTLEVGLYYQTCDISQCLPPELEMIKLNL